MKTNDNVIDPERLVRAMLECDRLSWNDLAAKLGVEPMEAFDAANDVRNTTLDYFLYFSELHLPTPDEAAATVKMVVERQDAPRRPEDNRHPLTLEEKVAAWRLRDLMNLSWQFDEMPRRRRTKKAAA